MADSDPPKIEFPCAYPIKVMGLDVDNFQQEVLVIIRRHAPDLLDEQVSARPSSGGRYLAVSAVITATGIPQLEAIFEDLKASGRVTLVL